MTGWRYLAGGQGVDRIRQVVDGVGALPELVTSLLYMWWPLAGAIAGTGAAVVFAVRHRLREVQARAHQIGARFIRVLVPPSVDAQAGMAFWANMAGLARRPPRRPWLGRPYVSFEYSFSAVGVQIGLWVPGRILRGTVERAVEAAWPGAQTQTEEAGAGCGPVPVPVHALVSSGFDVDSSNTVPPPVRAVGGRLRLARTDIHPLRDRCPADPLRALLGACSSLNPTEFASVQVLARPAGGRRLRRFRKTFRTFRETPPITPSSKRTLFDLVTPGPRSKTSAARADVEHSAQVRAAMAKNVGPMWETVIHYVVVTNAPVPTGLGRQQSELGRLRGHAHAVVSAFGIHAERNWWVRGRMTHLLRAVSERRFAGGDLLSLAELAGIAHLPFDVDAPGVSRAGARSVSAPPAAVGPSRTAKPVGRSDVGTKRPIGLAAIDARQHLHIVGKTGCGKSSLMANLVLADIDAGRGAVVIDPKGDLVSALIERLPERAVGRTVLIDPQHEKIRPAMNVLSVSNDREIPSVVDSLVGIFHRIYGGNWGPRTDDLLRSTALTLLKTRGSGRPPTLADIPAALMAGDAARLALTSRLQDPMLLSFWDWYGQLSDGARAVVVGPLMNKLRAFLLRDFVRQTVSVPASNFRMSEVLDGGVLLARLPKGILGEETSSLLGSLIVAGVWRAAQARVRKAENDRVDCALYLDEGQNFLKLAHPLEDMFAEARGYRLSICFAHQNLGQLSTELREALSANARSKIFFNASPEDSRLMERHTAPVLGAFDLAHLGAYQAAVRLLSNGQETSAFTVKTEPMPTALPGRAQAVLASAAARWPAVPEPAGAALTADPRISRPAAPDLSDTLELEFDPEFLRGEGGMG